MKERYRFDSAEEKAEWEETHFGTEDEDAAYERERQRELDEQECKHMRAFNDWLKNAGLESRKDNQEAIGIIRNAFFAGASYGIDQTAKVYRGEK